MHINHRRTNKHKCEKPQWRHDNEVYSRYTGLPGQRARRLKSSRRYRRKMKVLVSQYEFETIHNWGRRDTGYKSPGKYIWITD